MKKSSGLLVWRKKDRKIEILLVHHGGPFWKNKDKNAWSIPKGEIEPKESFKKAAIREFEEETGIKLSDLELKRISYLGKVSGYNKLVYIFVLRKSFGNDLKPKFRLVQIKHPFQPNKELKFPEIDKVSYVNLKDAQEKLVIYQKKIIPLFINYLKNFNKKSKNFQI